MNISVNSFYTKQTTMFAISAKGDAGFAGALDGVFAAKGIEKELGALGDPDLKSMYVHVSAHKYHLSRAERQAMDPDAYFDALDQLYLEVNTFELYHDDRYINVPVGCNELPDLIDRLTAAYNDGVSLKDALMEQCRKYTGLYAGKFVDIDVCDSLWVNTANGDIEYVTQKQRRGEIYCGESPAELDLDMTAALAVADDFATFMRYTWFRKESDDPATINAIICEIKEMRYNTTRYIPLNDAEIAAHEADRKDYYDLLEKVAEAQLDELLDLIDRHFGIVEEGLEMREKAAAEASGNTAEPISASTADASESASAGATFFMSHKVTDSASELAAIV